MHPPPALEALLVLGALFVVDHALERAPDTDPREPRGPAFQVLRFATLFLVSIILFALLDTVHL